jgi:hypothetical protein
MRFGGVECTFIRKSEAIAVETPTGVLVLTVITRYFEDMR